MTHSEYPQAFLDDLPHHPDNYNVEDLADAFREWCGDAVEDEDKPDPKRQQKAPENVSRRSLILSALLPPMAATATAAQRPRMVRFGNRWYDIDKLRAVEVISRTGCSDVDETIALIEVAAKLFSVPSDGMNELAFLACNLWEIVREDFRKNSETESFSRRYPIGTPVRFYCHMNERVKVGHIFSHAYDCGEFGRMVAIMSTDAPYNAGETPACFPLDAVRKGVAQ